MAARQCDHRRRPERYGQGKAVMKIAGALFDVATAARELRLPELYCGFDRADRASSWQGKRDDGRRRMSSAGVFPRVSRTPRRASADGSDADPGDGCDDRAQSARETI
jgi:hypothetical protein